MASLIQIFTFSLHKQTKNTKPKIQRLLCMTLRWKQRKHTPTLYLPGLAFPPHFALSQTLGFYLHPFDFEAEYF